MIDDTTNFKGNFSTILTWIYFLIGPILLKYGITQDIFMSLAYAIIGVIIAIWSSKNPNTFAWLGNQKQSTEQQLVLKEIVLNEEYEAHNENDNGGEDGC